LGERIGAQENRDPEYKIRIAKRYDDGIGDNIEMAIELENTKT